MSTKKSLLFKISTDIREFQKGMRQATTDLRRFGKQMKDMASGFNTYVTLPVALAGAGAVKMASDFEESMNKVNVAFGESAEKVRNWAKTSITSFGAAEGSALDMAALYGDMATSMGFGTDAAATMAMQLSQLAGDLSSFKNIPIKQAMTALNGVFTGETESLKMLGVVMTETNLQEFALAEGIKKKVNEMTQAEKVGLRYQYVISKTANAQGDFARTGGGAANQMRILTEGLKQLGAKFGEIILPAFTAVVSKINTAIKAIDSLNPVIKQAIVVVAGLAAAIGPLLYTVGFFAENVLPTLKIGLEAVKDGFKKLHNTMLAHPYYAIAAAIAVVVSALLIYKASMQQVSETQKSINAVNKKTADEFDTQKSKIEQLKRAVEDNNNALYYRLDALQQLQAIVPDYNASITAEGNLIDNNTTALETYLKTIEKEIKLKAYKQQLEEQYLKKIQAENKVRAAQEKVNQIPEFDPAKGTSRSMPFMAESSYTSNANRLRQENINAQKELAGIVDSIQAIENEINGLSVVTGKGTQSVNDLKIELQNLEKIKLTATGDELEGIEARISEITKAIELLSGAAKPGRLQQLEDQLKSLNELRLNFQGPESGLASLNDKIKEVQKEITRLNSLTNELGSFDPTKIIRMTAVGTQSTALQTGEGQQLANRTIKIDGGKWVELNDTFATMRETLSGIVDLIGSGLTSAFESALTSGEDFWKVLGKMLVDLVKKLVAAVAAAFALSVIMSAFTGGASSALNFLSMGGKGFGDLFKGLFGKMSGIPGMATGGIVPPGFPNDSYPAMLSSREMVIPSPQALPMMGGNMTVTGRLVADGSQLLAVIDNASLKRNKIRGY